MRRYVVALALVGLCAVPARAQDALLRSCAQQLSGAQYTQVPQSYKDQFRTLCAQAVHSISNVQPSVGIAFSGGNPVLGTGSTLGKRLRILPRVSVTGRANVAFTELPDLFNYSAVMTGNDQALEAMETLGVPIGSLQGDVALGVFNGISLAPMIGGVGAIDLLGSVAYLPVIDEVGLTEAIMNIGVGARVGLLKQGLLVPGVSVSGMYRRMGEVGFGDLNADDPAEFDTNLETLSLRAVASKGILMVDIALGAGYDTYASDLGLGWRLRCETNECTQSDPNGIEIDGRIDGELSTAAWNVFGDVALNLLMLNVIGEVGYQKATAVIGMEDLENAGFQDPRELTAEELKGGRFFGSVGLRISL